MFSLYKLEQLPSQLLKIQTSELSGAANYDPLVEGLSDPPKNCNVKWNYFTTITSRFTFIWHVRCHRTQDCITPNAVPCLTLSVKIIKMKQCTNYGKQLYPGIICDMGTFTYLLHILYEVCVDITLLLHYVFLLN